MSELTEYQQRLEDLITISKVKDFDQVNSKQYRELIGLRIFTHMPANELYDCLEDMEGAEVTEFVKGVGAYLAYDAEIPLKGSAEIGGARWAISMRAEIQLEFYAMLNKITEEDDERRAEGSMAEGV